MSYDRDFPQSAIDVLNASPLPDSGAIDACLAWVRRADAADPATARLNARLAEALVHRGRVEEALECGRCAFAAAASGDEATLRLCAWLFSNCGRDREAALAYAGLIACRP